MSVDLVLIGRNEGARLAAALAAARGQANRLVYVDSGSTDGSVAAARGAGALVVELDMSVPFSAARARNAGFEAAQAQDDAAPFVQFVDGDCALVPGWLDAAEARLRADSDLALVTGWRSEIHRDASVYNQMCDHEWRRPAGPITHCGGDMMVRAAAWRAVGGMNPALVAGEDEEIGLRLHKAGWKLERLPLEMTRHDAAITRFGQWWRRTVRAGHAFAHVGTIHLEHFRTERRRVIVYALILPVVAVAGAFVSGWIPLAVAGLYLISYARTVKGLRRAGLPWREALSHSLFLSLSKFPNLIGMATYWRRHLGRQAPEIIEYQ